MSNDNLTLSQARSRVNAAIVLPIAGLLVAAIVGVASARLFTNPPAGFDTLGLVLFVLAGITGAANLIAAQLTKTASSYTSEKTNEPLKAVRAAKGTLLGFHIEWIALNGIFLLVLIGRLGMSNGVKTDLPLLISSTIITLAFVALLATVNVIFIVLRSRTRTKA